ncbi:MAG: F0F1 ATP synthase subunit gamma [Gammaproteobacteria bacterium]|jgi:F-type H+-transporting ATPase subunit gamma|uniref:F0F1 ATP synthase subunit gamma n=1 Tax=Thiomicrorhabdus cannonii TaxID=2748011 RepID=UPI0015BC462D|nr:F0F1 ATP synthase subunit gamma [Thiomicrorhabdus cannonii]MBD3754865.1 F0F1 ATP synthase subunit gamma [Gammaproteobacteria bacterium]MBD3767942.1 F0F1 ATP synthase subunit gamma [Gammaproteobacteria bacterium]MBD3776314.1 F0F1 ATP synthase subunit gamma [Thiotrichales bacterium]
MAGGSKEIRAKIASVTNTKKITKAMEMVAASKMRRAQARMEATKPYVEKVKRVISHVAGAHPEYKHPYTQTRDKVKRVGLIMVSSDRGLCGGLNSNLFRKALPMLKQWKEQGVEVELALIGNKAKTFFRSYGGNVVAAVSDLGDTPHIEDLVGTIKVVLDKFDAGQIDEVYLASNEFVNTMAQNPTVQKIVPLEAEAKSETHWDYLYEPDAKTALDLLMRRYVESVVYGSVVENAACEQGARMMAMKNATDNAGEMIKELKLSYNKARQAAITQELSEIVAGSSAV